MASKFVVACFLPLLLPVMALMPVAAQEAGDLRQRFFTEAPVKWKQFEDLAWKVQAKVEIARDNTFSKQKSTLTSVRSYDVRQTASSALLHGGVVAKSAKDPVDYVFLSNSNYSAYLTQDPRKGSDFLLSQYSPTPDAILYPATTPIRTSAFMALHPHFLWRYVKLVDMVVDPNFDLHKVEPVVVAGENLVRVSFAYKFKTTELVKTVQSTTATAVMDPARYWCVRSSSEIHLIESPQASRGDIHTTYDIEDAAGGLPLCRKVVSVNSFDSDNLGKGEAKETKTYTVFTDEHLPESDFTLAKFGLPEPVDVKGKRPTPTYVWLLIAGGVCIVISFALHRFGLLKRNASEIGCTS